MQFHFRPHTLAALGAEMKANGIMCYCAEAGAKIKSDFMPL